MDCLDIFTGPKPHKKCNPNIKEAQQIKNEPSNAKTKQNNPLTVTVKVPKINNKSIREKEIIIPVILKIA